MFEIGETERVPATPPPLPHRTSTPRISMQKPAQCHGFTPALPLVNVRSKAEALPYEVPFDAGIHGRLPRVARERY